jgi:hypothetical protein
LEGFGSIKSPGKAEGTHWTKMCLGRQLEVVPPMSTHNTNLTDYKNAIENFEFYIVEYILSTLAEI